MDYGSDRNWCLEVMVQVGRGLICYVIVFLFWGVRTDLILYYIIFFHADHQPTLANVNGVTCIWSFNENVNIFAWIFDILLEQKVIEKDTKKNKIGTD